MARERSFARMTEVQDTRCTFGSTGLDWPFGRRHSTSVMLAMALCQTDNYADEHCPERVPSLAAGAAAQATGRETAIAEGTVHGADRSPHGCWNDVSRRGTRPQRERIRGDRLRRSGCRRLGHCLLHAPRTRGQSIRLPACVRPASVRQPVRLRVPVRTIFVNSCTPSMRSSRAAPVRWARCPSSGACGASFIRSSGEQNSSTPLDFVLRIAAHYAVISQHGFPSSYRDR